MNASSESGLCAALISRVFPAELLIRTEPPTWSNSTEYSVLRSPPTTRSSKRPLEPSRRGCCNHHFHHFSEKEWRQSERDCSLPASGHDRQPRNSCREQNHLRNHAAN